MDEQGRVGLQTGYARLLLTTVNAVVRKPVAIMDGTGFILDANASWHAFKDSQRPTDPGFHGSGNYLAAMTSAASREPAAAEIAAGLRCLMNGGKQQISVDYECVMGSARASYHVELTSGPARPIPLFIIVHEDTTVARAAERKLHEVTQ